MKRFSAKQQSLILFIFLSCIGASLQYILYRNDIEVIKRQTRYIFNLEDQRVREYLNTYSEILQIYKAEIQKSDHFNQERFEKIAHDLLLRFRDTKAFNFVDKNRVIQNINPVTGNEAALGKDLNVHPDPLIREKLRANLSRSSMTFIPPVNIYQGGVAIIFYVPLNFKSGDYGWMNLVILSKSLFKNYSNGLGFIDFDLAVIDKETGRSFFGRINSTVKSEDIMKFSSELLGREVTFYFDLSKQIHFQQLQSIKEFSFLLLMVFILSILFFLFSRNKKTLYDQYISVKNESNLLKTLIHDITNPIQSVLLGLHGLEMDKKYNAKNMEMILKKQNIAAEIINSIRRILTGKVLLEDRVTINLKTLIDDLLGACQNDLEASHILVEIHNEGSPLISSQIDEKVLKNQILRNVLTNAIKFSPHYSQIEIDILPYLLVVRNHHDFISDDQIKELGEMKPLSSSADSSSKRSLGLGMFITKIFCTQAQIDFSITQNRDSGMVEVTLRFPKL